MTLEEMYKTEKPIGGVQVTNTISMAVYEAVPGDDKAADQDAPFVTAWLCGDKPAENFRRTKVHTTAGGRNYISKNGYRFYLDEIIRIR